MRTIRLAIAFLLLATTASLSFAAGAVSMNWDTCTGPIVKSVPPGSVAALYVSVLGQEQLHKAYDVRVMVLQAGGLRDAWRFDAPGCQGSSLIAIDSQPVVPSKTCPIFMQTSAPSLQIKDYSYDALTGRARGVLANSYPIGVTAVNPATRYFLARFNFDHTFSTLGASDPGNTCGGLEIPMCAFFGQASWLTLDGIEIQWAMSQEFVLANDPNSLGCFTPAKSTTWGSIKSQYRN